MLKFNAQSIHRKLGQSCASWSLQYHLHSHQTPLSQNSHILLLLPPPRELNWDLCPNLLEDGHQKPWLLLQTWVQMQIFAQRFCSVNDRIIGWFIVKFMSWVERWGDNNTALNIWPEDSQKFQCWKSLIDSHIWTQKIPRQHQLGHSKPSLHHTKSHLDAK